ncbi:MAG: hypothetical protein COB17_09035 [Sulfurimonas sp.]|nr:MAG: hypothetical protein COB17_09035 [Sulfurimonas sp.]
MKKRDVLIISVAVVAMLTAGCGGGGGSGSSTATTVTVERGPVFNAIVTDSSNPPKTATLLKGTNKYTFASTPTYPITAAGGVVDLDEDGDGDYQTGVVWPVEVSLVTEKGTNITPLTTHLNDLDKNQEAQFAAKYNLNPDSLFDLASVASGNIVAAINSIYFALVSQSKGSSNTVDDDFTNIFTTTFFSLANDNATSDNIIESLIDLEALVNTALGLSSEEAVSDNTTSDNTTSDNTTSDNITG